MHWNKKWLDQASTKFAKGKCGDGGAWHAIPNPPAHALANAGHDTRAIQAWTGHKNIQHTVRYTELAPDRFKDFWRE
jgi:integrase